MFIINLLKALKTTMKREMEGNMQDVDENPKRKEEEEKKLQASAQKEKKNYMCIIALFAIRE